MKKSDLKSGLVAENREGNTYLVVGENLVKGDMFVRLKDLDEDLNNIGGAGSGLDIVKIYKTNNVAVFNELKGKHYMTLLWSRAEEEEANAKIALMDEWYVNVHTIMKKDWLGFAKIVKGDIKEEGICEPKPKETETERRAKVEQAFKDGADLEVYSVKSGKKLFNWCRGSLQPSWYWHSCDYRIKPKEEVQHIQIDIDTSSVNDFKEGIERISKRVDVLENKPKPTKIDWDSHVILHSNKSELVVVVVSDVNEYDFEAVVLVSNDKWDVGYTCKGWKKKHFTLKQ